MDFCILPHNLLLSLYYIYFRSIFETCMVLAGSIAEAMILNALKQSEQAAIATAKSLGLKVGSNLNKWHLYEMVQVGINLPTPILPADAETGADQIRKWRNLIHPGRELRDAASKRIKPTAARARNAVAFLQFIADELAI